MYMQKGQETGMLIHIGGMLKFLNKMYTAYLNNINQIYLNKGCS